MTEYPRTPRLVNHFSLGADPEWTMRDAKGTDVYPETRGLDTLSAFGCDMCGRVAEARTCSSKFALEVVASLIDALRWIPVVHVVDDLNWLALTFTGRDGCGGHVHFGQRRIKDPNALDETVKWLLAAKVFDKESFKARQTTKYGHYADFRAKSYGYEYRTLPTWMSSPWQAYLTIVICKLIAHQGKPSSWDPKKPDQGVRELLEQYRYQDDDANIAYLALQRKGMPYPHGYNFAPYWGVLEEKPIKTAGKTFIPSCIYPEQQTCLELFEYLTQGKALPKRKPVATWLPVDLPEGFFKIAVQLHSLGHLPDAAMNLISKAYPVYIQMNNEFTIVSPISLPQREISKRLREFIPEIKFVVNPPSLSITIYVPDGMRQSQEGCAALNKVLQDTDLFPICHYKKFYQTDWTKWDQPKATIKPLGLIGRKLM